MLHVRINAQTMEMRAIEVTPNSVVDAPVQPSLLGQVDPHEALLSARHEAIAPGTRPSSRCAKIPGNLGAGEPARDAADGTRGVTPSRARGR